MAKIAIALKIKKHEGRARMSERKRKKIGEEKRNKRATKTQNRREKKGMQVAVIKSQEWLNIFGNAVTRFPLERVRSILISCICVPRRVQIFCPKREINR